MYIVQKRMPLQKKNLQMAKEVIRLINLFIHGVLVVMIMLWYSSFSTGMPPPNPLKCDQVGCTLYNSYGIWGDRKDCRVPYNNVVYPTTEDELRSAVASANKNNFKVKVVTKFSHTIPKWACPVTLQTTGGNAVLISTAKYNSTVSIDKANMRVTADAGVGLRDLIDKVEKEGLSLVVSPYWEGVTVAGLISTGAHGSSWWGNGGAVHDHVVGLRLIVPASESEGYAKIIDLDILNPLLNAAKLSLGMLGVISKVTLTLEKGFKRSITYNFTGEDGIEEEFKEHAAKHEFADIQWYPSKHTAVYRNDDRVPLNASGDGVNDFIGFQSNAILVSQSVRTAEKAFEKARNVNGKCTLASSFVEFKKLSANGLKNNLIFTGYPVIGHQGKMQTSGSCLYSSTSDILSSCSWDPRIKGLFFYESTAIFPAKKFGDFVRDVKKLRDLNPQDFCGIDIYNGFLIRFIKASEAYLGQSEDSVVVDWNYYRADEGSTPRLNQDVWEEVEQMAFHKYGAKPHWAKNRNIAFEDVQKKYPNYGKFVAAKKKLDPRNMFSTELADVKDDDGCALEGQCICSEDRHCSPSKGYFCQPGIVYKEARVCRYSSSSSWLSKGITHARSKLVDDVNQGI